MFLLHQVSLIRDSKPLETRSPKGDLVSLQLAVIQLVQCYLIL